MDIFVIKTPSGALMPASESDREQLRKIKTGQPCRVTLRRVRNYEFHKKFFALMQFAYDNWEPPHNEVAHKDFDRFRKDVTILAGYYDQTLRLDGETRVEAKSIAFHAMSEDDFEKLYVACIEVITKYVLRTYSGDQLRAVLEQVEEFA